MKTKILFALPLVTLLSGCFTTGGGSVTPVLPDNIKSAVLTTCGVVLTAQSLAQLIPLFSGTAADLTGFAANVCSKLTPLAQGGRGGTKVTVAGDFMGRRIFGTKVR